MNDSQKGTVTYDRVAEVATAMLANGLTPTVRSVLEVTGGKTTNVSAFLSEFMKKQDEQVLKLAETLGSGEVAKLLAAEIQNGIIQRTAAQGKIIESQAARIEELQQLLEQTAADAEAERLEAAKSIEQAKAEAAEQVQAAASRADAARARADEAVSEAQRAQQGAAASVDAARTAQEKAENEAQSLREQVKQLSIDAAKRELLQAESEQNREQLAALRLEHAQRNTDLAEQRAELRAAQKEITRLEGVEHDARKGAADLVRSQAELVQMSKRISELEKALGARESEIARFERLIPETEKKDREKQ